MNQNLLNRQALEVWKEIDPKNWTGIVKEILGVYLSSVPQDFEKFVIAKKSLNYSEMQRIAHSLKSSSGNVGAQTLQFLFQSIEEACHNGHSEQALQLSENIEIVFNGTIIEIKKLVQEM